MSEKENQPMNPNGNLKTFIDLSKSRGTLGVIGVLLATTTVILQLSSEQLRLLKEMWPIIVSPAVFVLIGDIVNKWLKGRDKQIQIQVDTSAKLERILIQIATLVAQIANTNIAVERRFDYVDQQSSIILKTIEKRKEYRHGDTEKFKVPEKKSQ